MVLTMIMDMARFIESIALIFSINFVFMLYFNDNDLIFQKLFVK